MKLTVHVENADVTEEQWDALIASVGNDIPMGVIQDDDGPVRGMWAIECPGDPAERLWEYVEGLDGATTFTARNHSVIIGGEGEDEITFPMVSYSRKSKDEEWVREQYGWDREPPRAENTSEPPAF